jgi:hypothetical protein
MSEPVSPLPKLLAPINQLLAPLVKAGVGNPWLFTPGATVLEVPGRNSGQLRCVPLSCYLAGGVMIIGTVRPNSQWIKNLAAAETPYVWLWGRRHCVTKLSVTEHVACLSLPGCSPRRPPSQA